MQTTTPLIVGSLLMEQPTYLIVRVVILWSCYLQNIMCKKTYTFRQTKLNKRYKTNKINILISTININRCTDIYFFTLYVTLSSRQVGGRIQRTQPQIYVQITLIYYTSSTLPEGVQL